VQHRGEGDGHERLARAHLPSQNGSTLSGIEEQPGEGLHDCRLGREGLAQQALQHRLAAGVGHSVVDRRVLPGDGLEQPVAEVGEEPAQGNDGRGCRRRGFLG